MTLTIGSRLKYERRGDFANSKTRARQLRRIYIRDQAVCCHCRQFVMREEASREHIIPLRLGGSTLDINVALSHKECNR